MACCTCSTPAGFFIFIFLVLSIAIVVLRRVKRCNEGILREARFDETTQRNPRQHGSQCESDFRRHVGDQSRMLPAKQAFYYNFVMHLSESTWLLEASAPIALRTHAARSILAPSRMHIDPDSLPTGRDGIIPRLQKGPTIHSSAWVVPGATVLGDVILEEESSVWYSAVLRGDINRIVIGPRSNVQDNAVVHVDTGYPTSVGELVTIGHTAILHACKIDDEVLVGMGS